MKKHPTTNIEHRTSNLIWMAGDETFDVGVVDVGCWDVFIFDFYGIQFNLLPIPLSQYPHILLAHGGGGRLSQQLIEKLFLPAFQNPALNQRHDGAVIEFDGRRLAFTTDSYVVRPLFFPGGDIGTLAMNGQSMTSPCAVRGLFT